MITILYNNQDLGQVPGLRWVDRPINDMPSRTLTRLPLARSNKSVLVNAQYEYKQIKIDGEITANSRELAEASIDMLKGLLVGLEQPLDVQQAGNTRRYTASLKAISTILTGGFVQFSLEFEAADPAGFDPSPATLLTNTTFTVSNQTLPVVVSGSYQAQPRITITFGTITGGTNANVQIFNTYDNIGITVNRTWSSGDILIIDSAAKVVTVNNIPTNFVGRFPVWNSGFGNIGYSDQLTTRSVTVGAAYTKRYI